MVTTNVRETLKTTSFSDLQMNLWHEPFDREPHRPTEIQRVQTFGWLWIFRHNNPRYFASAVLNGTTTGVLRHHALRLNSTVTCQAGGPVPSSCSGPQPFFTQYQHAGPISSGITASVCVEGDHSSSPWTRSRDRQDITEKMWISVQVDQAFRERLAQPVTPFVISCTASSTRGYFELGNYQNDQVFGPLLEKWPSQEDIEQNFNDYVNWRLDGNHTGGHRRPVAE